MPMKIPIYYLPLWGNPYQIVPDSLFVNGPAEVGFNTAEFINQHPGWLKNYHEWASDADRSGADLINLIAANYSVSPHLLLALLEFWSHALTEPSPPAGAETYPLGYAESNHQGVYLQLIWTANTLNNGYYRWRNGQLQELDLKDGSLERLDPWQNASTVSLHYYFSLLLSPESYAQAVSADGFAAVYKNLFGDPWQKVQPHIPGSLEQPGMRLPFSPGKRWAFTGGPHTGWGIGDPLSAVDFAPPSTASGCIPTDEWVTAVADGVVVRSEDAIVVLDLDGDGDLRTGWDIFYLHMATEGRIARGTRVKAGDPLGHPSCEGGEATGTHVHMARLYNGEWIPAGGIAGVLPFNMEGWVVQNGAQAYEGTLTRYSRLITACTCSDANSQLASEGKP
jgi:murein DD-endopeptidase MepM/ murein hydrolase activator NlpD